MTKGDSRTRAIGTMVATRRSGGRAKILCQFVEVALFAAAAVGGTLATYAAIATMSSVVS